LIVINIEINSYLGKFASINIEQYNSNKIGDIKWLGYL